MNLPVQEIDVSRVGRGAVKGRKRRGYIAQLLASLFRGIR